MPAQMPSSLESTPTPHGWVSTVRGRFSGEPHYDYDLPEVLGTLQLDLKRTPGDLSFTGLLDLGESRDHVYRLTRGHTDSKDPRAWTVERVDERSSWIQVDDPSIVATGTDLAIRLYETLPEEVLLEIRTDG